MQRRLRAFLGLGTSLLVVATCTESPTAAHRGPVVTLVPRFTPNASAVASRLASFSITIDNVRIVIVRPVADTLLDTSVVVPPGDTVLSLELEVPHSSVGEAL